MGIVASSNIYLSILGAGSLVAVTSAYVYTKYKRQSSLKNESSEEYEDFSNVKESKDPDDDYRLILGIRNDLKMQKGKVAAQCGHAAIAAYIKASKQKPKTLKRWLKYGSTKIAVKVDSEQELLSLEKRAKELGVISSIVRDAGRTQVAPGSRTVIAIGPASTSVIDKITGHLKLY